jgi:hypothetical protein
MTDRHTLRLMGTYFFTFQYGRSNKTNRHFMLLLLLDPGIIVVFTTKILIMEEFMFAFPFLKYFFTCLSS